MTETKNRQTKKLGTFSGVFTPSILTILGIILFLRLGFVVGSAGLGKALFIIAIANLITVLTSFSLAAVATNMKVKGGGDYYLISRTLGVEFGGAIGIVLFLAQSVSIAFYCIGFGEAVSAILANSGTPLSPQIIAFLALIFLFFLAWVGADLATKFQFIVMAFLVLALVSFYTGAIQNWNSDLLAQGWTRESKGLGFWVLFALFFPAVTGFTQGVSMSGDLEDPGKSLPKGTFLAVGISILVYFTVAILFAGSTPLDTLATDYGSMKKTALSGFLIDAGVIAATLSSAMASFLGAPRILQSLAGDKIFPFLVVFAKGYGKGNNPRRGVLLSLLIAVLVIALGQLDLIARVVSMFFLISYGLLNYATYFEAATLSPSFRPRLRWYNRYVSLAGFLACIGVMLAIDIKTGIAASAVLFAIYQYLKQTQGPARWADSQRSYHLQQVRSNLLAAQEDIEHPKEWRPNIIVLSNDYEASGNLISFSELIEGRSGITTAARLFLGSGFRSVQLKAKYLDELKKQLALAKRHAFPMVISAVDTETALSTLFQSYGIGPVKANTVLFNYPELINDPGRNENQPRFARHLRIALQNGCNLVLLNSTETKSPDPGADYPLPEKKEKQIDVWWQADDTSHLMLLLAYLITRNTGWEDANIMLRAVNYDRDNADNIRQLSGILEDARIQAEPSIVLGLDPDTIVRVSKGADLTFLPATLKEDAPCLFSRFTALDVLKSLGTAALVTAASRIDLGADPEEGKIHELALIHDDLERAEKRASLAQKSADLAARTAAEKMAALKENSGHRQDLKETIHQMLEARQLAKAAKEKAIKEKTALSEALEKAREEGLEVNDPEEDPR